MALYGHADSAVARPQLEPPVEAIEPGMAPSPVRATESKRSEAPVTRSLARGDMWKQKPLNDSLRGCLTLELDARPVLTRLDHQGLGRRLPA